MINAMYYKIEDKYSEAWILCTNFWNYVHELRQSYYVQIQSKIGFEFSNVLHRQNDLDDYVGLVYGVKATHSGLKIDSSWHEKETGHLVPNLKNENGRSLSNALSDLLPKITSTQENRIFNAHHVNNKKFRFGWALYDDVILIHVPDDIEFNLLPGMIEIERLEFKLIVDKNTTDAHA